VIHVESNEAGLEQRLSSLQAQIESLRQAAPDTGPLEQRLSTLTEYSTDILRQWAATVDRHARAVTQLEAHLRELGDAGNRLQHDAAQRLHDLERIVKQEWAALRDVHEAPVRQLVEQAANLTEVCIATANSAQHGFDRAEARLANLEADFHRTTSELTRELHTVLQEVRQLSANGQRQLPSEPPAWPLEGVTRLHSQLREASSSPRALPAGAVPEVSSPFTTINPASMDARADIPDVRPQPPGPTFSRAAVAVLLVVLLIAGVFGWRYRRDVQVATQQAEQARLESRIAVEKASREAAERQEAAARQLETAQTLVARAQTIGDVIAAPDLIRYTLANTGLLPDASGQVLWSRTRGFVFSASGLPPSPPGSTYQVWMLTRAGAVSATTFAPDDSGRVTMTRTLNIPRAVVGAIVTIEPKGGAATPSGERVLARLPVAPPPEP
jgi:hypothetical protein